MAAFDQRGTLVEAAGQEFEPPEPLLACRQILLGLRQKGCLGGGRRRCRVAPRRGLASHATLSTGKTYGLVYATRGVFAAKLGYSMNADVLERKKRGAASCRRRP
jgi:hypothetical protein